MLVPSWWGLALLGLAAYRTWRLLAEDSILDKPRLRLYQRIRKESFVDFLECPWCSGAWCAIAWYMLWWWEGNTVLAIASIFALSAVVGLIPSLLNQHQE